MKNLGIQMISIVLLSMVALAMNAQEASTENFSYSVDRVLKPLSISPETLNDAKNIKDLNRHYPDSWARSYKSVEISVLVKGEIKKAISKNDVLTPTQKELMEMADKGSEIAVLVKYIPENNLEEKIVREFPFKFMVNAHQTASYPGGYKALIKYVEEKAIEKIPEGVFTGYLLAAVTFNVDEDGSVKDIKIFQSSNDKMVDEILLQTITEMPNWKPATYNNSTTIKQAFALTVGNMESCTLNLLNIKDPIE